MSDLYTTYPFLTSDLSDLRDYPDKTDKKDGFHRGNLYNLCNLWFKSAPLSQNQHRIRLFRCSQF